MRPPVRFRVLFDEAHCEAWTIRPELAERMQPAHPADCSMGQAAEALRRHDAEVVPLTEGQLDSETLAGVDVLVIAHPSESRWEKTTGIGTPTFTPEEMDAVERFVAAGGGLLVLGETEQEKYGNNLYDLLGRFEIFLENDTVQDYEHNLGAPSWITAELAEGPRGRPGDPLARVREVCLYRAGTLTAGEGARVLARTHRSASTPGAPLIAVAQYGQGRVAALADSDLFGDDCLDALDHRNLWVDLITWLAPTRGGDGQTGWDVPVLQDPAWTALRDATDALGRLQADDGSLAEAAHAPAASEHVAELLAQLPALARHFPHQREYLLAAADDLRAWEAGGFARPDFARSLDLFRPDLHRENGSCHLAFFPMYKQNGSRATCFEALIVRVPWPGWIAELERTRYDNAKFVPVELLDATRGYRSGECATLFPETVATGVPPTPPANHFGAIFCDREAARLRRVAGAAVDLLGLNLPPDAARMLQDPELCQTAYILWDLIHDRAHSHGELPFDPFMIRQRAPYWMYSLEELRCDLTAFVEAERLVREEGLGAARQVQYAILLDRLLRFPISGNRVRNYDGLGGQLLFAHLRRQRLLRWADNRLTIDWRQVNDGVISLRAAVEELYHAGIDRTKLAHWAAAHDLVAGAVAPAAGSRWAAAARDFGEPEDPRALVDLVLPDEFPLSIFYSTLQTKLSAELQPVA